MCLDGVGEIVESVAALLPASFDDSEHRLDEATTASALRPEGQFAPDDGMTESTLTCVVGWLDFFVSNKLPQPFAMVVQLAAHAHERFVVAGDTAQQQTLYFTADRSHAPDESGATDSAVAIIAPVFE